METQTNGALAPMTTATTAAAIERAQPTQALGRTALTFSPEQRKMIRDSLASGASESEFAMLMAVAEARGLNPLLKQIYFVKRWDSQKRCEVWAYQVAIDGFRSIAEATGLYDGQDEPTFEHDRDGNVTCARVKVYRKDVSRPFVGLAYFAEYAQKTKDGQPTKFWRDMPHSQLAKCAEALALRKAFPEKLGGLYTGDEMAQADNPERDVTPAQKGAQRLADIKAAQAARAAAPAAEPEPPHDATTGEVLRGEVEPAGESYAFRKLGDAIDKATSQDALNQIAKAIREAKEAGDLLPGERERLSEVYKARKVAIERGQ